MQMSEAGPQEERVRGWVRRERASELRVYNSAGADAGFEGNFVGS